METKQPIDVLDSLRGLSAIYVVACHAVKMTGLRDVPVVYPLLYAHYAVLVFFLLSGFVIHLRQVGQTRRDFGFGMGNWLKNYAWRRGMRIYVPLLVAVAFTVCLRAILAAQPFTVFLADIKRAVFVIIPLGAVLQWNVPLWSVQYEIWFYALYALVVSVCVARFGISFNTVFLALFPIGLIAWIGSETMPGEIGRALKLPMYFSLWGLGAIVAHLWVAGKLERYAVPMLALGVAIIAALIPITPTNGEVGNFIDYPWALGIALIIAGLLSPRVRSKITPAIRLTSVSAAWSYSLYLVHYPILKAMTSRLDAGASDSYRALLAISGSAASLVAALLLWYAVERRATLLARRPPAWLLTGRPQPRGTPRAEATTDQLSLAPARPSDSIPHDVARQRKQ